MSVTIQGIGSYMHLNSKLQGSLSSNYHNDLSIIYYFVLIHQVYRELIIL